MSVILLFQGSEIAFTADPSTFTELVDEIAERLNLTSQDDKDRIGRQINRRYKRITTAVGLQTTRRRQLARTLAEGASTVIFTGAEKIINVIDKSVNPYKILDEISIEELRSLQPYASVKPTQFAIIAQTASSVTIEVNCVSQDVCTLYADVHSNVANLTGLAVPLIPDSFHDSILWGTLADEYLKLEKMGLNTKCEDQFVERVSDLKMFIAKSAQEIFQGKLASGSSTSSGGSGGSSSVPDGTASYIQTGQIIFDRTGALDTAPFAVVAGAATVPNLGADTLDGLDSTAFMLVGTAPSAHHTTHESGGSDSIKLDDLALADDNSDLNASTFRHGLMKKFSGNATDFFDGTGSFDTIKDSDLVTSDITTNDVTIAKHGFTPKAPNDTSKFFRGDSTWAVPPLTSLSAAWPVGSVYIAVVSTNPATLLGFGTWSAFATGRTLVGIDAGQTEFDVVEETGGAKTHTLTTAELAVHTHTQNSHNHNNFYQGIAIPAGGTFNVAVEGGGGISATTNIASTATNQNAGSGTAHNNLQPYIVVFMWKRVS